MKTLLLFLIIIPRVVSPVTYNIPSRMQKRPKSSVNWIVKSEQLKEKMIRKKGLPNINLNLRLLMVLIYILGNDLR